MFCPHAFDCEDAGRCLHDPPCEAAALGPAPGVPTSPHGLRLTPDRLRDETDWDDFDPDPPDPDDDPFRFHDGRASHGPAAGS